MKSQHLYVIGTLIIAALAMTAYSLATGRVFSFWTTPGIGMITHVDHPRAYWGFTIFYAAFGLIFGWMRVRMWQNVRRGGSGRG